MKLHSNTPISDSAIDSYYEPSLAQEQREAQQAEAAERWIQAHLNEMVEIINKIKEIK